MKRTKPRRVLAAVMAAALIMTGCSSADRETATDDTGADVRPVMSFTREDMRTSPVNIKIIDLGSSGDRLTITDGGDYRLSGEMNGSVFIAAEDQIVHLFLSGVSVRSSSDPAVRIESAGKVIITAEAGSVNTFADSGKNTDEIYDACIFSLCDLTINGSGTIEISGFYRDAVHTKDFLRIKDANLRVTAKDDGLHGNDGILVSGAHIDVQAEGCGLRTTKTGKELKGNIEIYGSSLSVIAGEHALNASRSIYIESGSVFLKGVMSNTRAGGGIYIGEGCLTNG